MANINWEKILQNIRKYRYILLSILISIGIMSALLIWNHIESIQFSSRIKNVEKSLVEELPIIYRKYNDKFITTRSLFIKGFFYGKFLQILLEKLPKYEKIIMQGNWPLLIKNLQTESNLSPHLLKIANIQEEIYQYTKNKNPYSSSLSPQHVDYYGELLNLMVFYHMSHRENKEENSRFFWNNSMQCSIFLSIAEGIFHKNCCPADLVTKAFSYQHFQDNQFSAIRDLLNF